MDELEFSLFEKYLRKEASDSERNQVEAWLEMQGFDRQDLALLMVPSEELKVMLSTDTRKDLTIIRQRLQQHKVRTFAPIWRIAASLLLIAVASSVVYYLTRDTQPGTESLKTIANHSSRYLQQTLPDGSLAFLNRDAEIIYDEDFSENRTVSMKGEVFFEVKPDASHPFAINAQHVRVKVIGTSFQVSEDAEGADVIVATGKVQMERAGLNPVFLEKGERGIYKNGQTQIARETNTNLNYLSWKTGILEFRNTPLDTVAADLEAYFGVTVTVRKQTGALPYYTSRFEKPSLVEVLEEIKLTLPVAYTVSGKDVVLTIQ